jgi:hypothetical protein
MDMAIVPADRFVEPAILLLLRRKGQVHGYELANELPLYAPGGSARVGVDCFLNESAAITVSLEPSH